MKYIQTSYLSFVHSDQRETSEPTLCRLCRAITRIICAPSKSMGNMLIRIQPRDLRSPSGQTTWIDTTRLTRGSCSIQKVHTNCAINVYDGSDVCGVLEY